MKNKKLHILGAGGHSKMAIDIAIDVGFSEICIHDDLVDIIDFYQKIPIEGTIESFIEECSENTLVFIGIGDNLLRSKLFKRLKEKSCVFPTLKHPSAIVNKHAAIDEGSIIMPNATVNLNVRIGKCGIINTNSVLDHDSKLGDFVHISPGVNIAGNVAIEDYSWLGIGATVINNIHIGKYSIVGAGSVVINDIRDNVTVFGIPAKEANKDA